MKGLRIFGAELERGVCELLPGCNSYGSDDNYAGGVIGAVLTFIGIIAVIMIIISGIQYMISAGDAGKVAKAKNSLIWSIVGLVVVVLAYAIVNFVLGAVS